MSDLRDRIAGQSLMEKFLSFRGTAEMRELPFGMFWITNEIASWRRGVRGELEMARELAALGPEWMVLHSVRVGDRGSDIDHLVVGPPGVFPINSKRLVERDVRVSGDTFRVDGRREKYLRNSRLEGVRVEKVLRAAQVRAPIVPLIAVSGARSLRVSNPTSDGWNIGVERVDRVVRRLKKRPERVSPDEVRTISEAFLDPTVWTRQIPTTRDTRALRAEFDRIDRGITRWNIALVSVLGVGFLVVALGLSIAWSLLFL